MTVQWVQGILVEVGSGGDENDVVLVVQHCECTKSYRIIHFNIVKVVNFI